MSKDILLYEDGDGGEMFVLNNDISLVELLYQQVYLLLFGGNIEANTTGYELERHQREDWWANSLLFKNEKGKQFNSNTERVLDSVALNTAGRIDIIRAIELDLKGLQSLANVSVNVIILSHTKIRINVTLEKPESLEDKLFQFIWDNAKKEIIIEKTI